MSYPYNQGPYSGQQPYPPPPGAYQQPPPPGAYPPPPPGGYTPQAGYPMPPQQGGYPTAPLPGFQPPPYGGNSGGGGMPSQGEDLPFNSDVHGYGAYNPEDGEIKGFDFTDQSIRRGFIRKVYSILMVQLTITLGFISLFCYHEPTKQFVQRTPSLFIIAFVVVIIAMILLACCGELRRKAPTNYIVLLIFTLAESFLLGVTSSAYKTDAVLMAVGITAAVCLALTLFAFQTKYDFTMMGGILLVAVIILLVFGIVAMFVRSRILNLVYASLGALLFSIYLIYDTQLMLGGKHKYSISPEEYVFAALNLYLDIINIFMYILAIIGNSRD